MTSGIYMNKLMKGPEKAAANKERILSDLADKRYFGSACHLSNSKSAQSVVLHYVPICIVSELERGVRYIHSPALSQIFGVITAA